MAKGSPQATEAGTAGLNQAGALASNASSLYSTLTPELQAEASAPPGYDPATMAQIKTSNMQTAGGSNAGAVGQGALLAARTRNAGAPAAAIGASTRRAGEELGSENLKAELSNADLQEKQRQEGLSGLSNLYGEQLNASNQALGIVPSAVNANTNAANEYWNWARYLLDPILSPGGSSIASSAISAGAGAGGGGGGGGG